MLSGRLGKMSVWLWSHPVDGAAAPLLVVVDRGHPTLIETMKSVFADDRGDVEILQDRRRRQRRRDLHPFAPERRRAERRREPPREARISPRSLLIRRAIDHGLDYTAGHLTKGDARMMSVESKQIRDGDEVRRWLEAGQSQLAALLELVHEHERLRERVDAAERENERLRGVTYENEQLRNRLETAERQGDQLREAVTQLRAENDRHQREREEAAERVVQLVNEVVQRLRPGAATVGGAIRS